MYNKAYHMRLISAREHMLHYMRSTLDQMRNLLDTCEELHIDPLTVPLFVELRGISHALACELF